MRAILPGDLILADHPQVRLIDQICGLKRSPGEFFGDVAVGQPSQLVIYDRDQPVERFAVSIAPRKEKPRNFLL
jgi:hypothetical protein